MPSAPFVSSQVRRTVFFLMAACACLAVPANAAISLVQAASAQATGVTSIAKAFSGGNTGGNLIVVFVRASTTSQTVSVRDSAGNSYTEAVGQTQTEDGHQTHIYYAKNIAAGPNTVTVSFSGTNNHPWLAIYEYSGLSTTAPLDRIAHAQGSGTAPTSGPTPTTTAANELVFAGAGLPASSTAQVTAGSGYVILQQNTSPGGTSPAANEGQTVAATGLFSGTFRLSASANWTAVVATFAATSPPAPLAITTSSLPDGTINTPYNATLAASGGVTPYAWSITAGSLPAGLNLNAGTGVISGTPTTAGTSQFTVQVTDSSTPTAQTAGKTLSIAINPPPTPLGITTTTLPNGMVKASYSATLAASGGVTPYTWAITSGSLPAGLSLNAGTGVISGTPAAAGTSLFSVQVTDSTTPTAQAASQALSITISPAVLAITTTALPNGVLNASYAVTLLAAGGAAPYTWSISSGSLPPGLNLDAATGVVSGILATGGAFTVHVTDSTTPAAQTATQPLSVDISPTPGPLTVTTTSLAGGVANGPYAAALAASGGTPPYTWSVASGSLPAGLSLNAGTGVISGTAAAAGTSNFTVQAADSTTPAAQTAAMALSITINTSVVASAALVQSAAIQGTGAASLSQVFPGGNTAGNLIIAFVRMSSASQTVTVSDSAGNSYVDAVSQVQTSDGHQTHIFYASNIKDGANTVTARFSSTNNHPWLAVYEYSGLSAASPLDRTARAQGGSTAPNSGLTSTTASPDELLFAGLGLPSSSGVTVAAGPGYTLELQDAIQFGSRAATENQFAGSTGAFAGAFGLSASANWTCVLATFKAAAPAATLVSIAAAPSNPSTGAGGGQQFMAIGTYLDGSSKILSSATWASADAAVATIDASGLVSALAPGTSGISATVGNISGGTTLTVTPSTLVSIAVTPINPSIAPGSTQQFTATGKTNGGTAPDVTGAAVWSSSATPTATVSGTGLASAVANGSSTIAAQYGSVSGSTTLTVSNAPVRHYEYVFPDGSMYVYDIDSGFALVKQINIPQAAPTRGVVVSIPTHTLYLSYGGDGPGNGNGSLLAYDLLTDQVMWSVNYSAGIDSMAITPDGKTIYMPTGELSAGGIWNVIDASNGNIIGTIDSGGVGPHNTVVSLDGTRVYMAPAHSTYLVVADTATNTVIRNIGPMVNGVRPFTINGKQTLAFTTASSFLGFQVSDIGTGQVLYTVPIAGFTIPPGFASGTPSHGISLSPLDERELWVMDSANSYVHVFDISGLPGSPPVQVADLPVSSMTGFESPCSYDCHRSGWLQHTLDGRYVVAGDSGDILDAATRTIVVHLDPLYNTRKHLEIDWQNGLPIATTTRYGLGHVTQ